MNCGSGVTSFRSVTVRIHTSAFAATTLACCAMSATAPPASEKSHMAPAAFILRQ